jgi:ATP adenylyltransferase
MDLLYSPWRSKYFSFGSTRRANANKDCPFCSKFGPHEDSAKALILKRFEHCCAMLNLYPYSAGHLLIIPYKHTSDISLLSKQERSEIFEATNACSIVLEKLFNCDGINIGINKGKASGGSVLEHTHIHILPRYIGDTNFLAALANTKPISFDLNDVYAKMLEHFCTISLE